MRAKRFGSGPIITPQTDGTIGPNINGPSLIRLPEWIVQPLGRYYLYFAAHRGTFIRLAYSDALRGPWQVYSRGTLHLAESMFVDHIASPDIHVDHGAHEMVLYYHGVCEDGTQATRFAVSRDGLNFHPATEIIAPPYLRAFDWDGWRYAMAMPGILHRSRTGRTPFEHGPTILEPNTRHVAVWVEDRLLYIVFSRAGDCPERLLLVTVELRGDWQTWRASESRVLLEPDADYEGGCLALRPSERGEAPGPCRELRDPAVYAENGVRYLLYTVAGESGIAIARIEAGADAVSGPVTHPYRRSTTSRAQ